MTFFTRLAKHDWSQEARDKAAKHGVAMPDGSFPIKSAKDVKDAIALAGKSNHPLSEVKAHIRARAKAIGAEGELPATW